MFFGREICEMSSEAISPLIKSGMGHDVMERGIHSARSRFEISRRMNSALRLNVKAPE
jgi:hypothetical protein